MAPPPELEAAELGEPANRARRAPVRIVCVGNAFVPGDDLGPRVHAALAGAPLPEGVELVDGGLGGLGLLRELDGARQVVFVDAVGGFGEPGAPVELRGAQALGAPGYGHGAGLAYLLHLLEARPEVCSGGRVPGWVLVGVEGPADSAAVADSAARALACALQAREAPRP